MALNKPGVRLSSHLLSSNVKKSQNLCNVGNPCKVCLAVLWLLGPLHVLWQVSFGCWVMWSISSWHEYIVWVSSFPSRVIGSRTLNYTKKKTIWHLAIWQNWCFGQFYHSKISNIEKFTFFSVFLVRGKSEKIESIHFAESSGLSCWETKKKFCYPSLSFGKEDTLIILLSTWDHVTQQPK